MTPVIVGLILAVPLAQWTANPATGRRLRRMKLLITPEESRPPEILERANALAAELAGADRRSAIERLFADPALLAAHRAMLPRAPHASPATSISRAWSRSPSSRIAPRCQQAATLTRAELMALLSDARGLDRLAALDRAPPSLKNMK